MKSHLRFIISFTLFFFNLLLIFGNAFTFHNHLQNFSLCLRDDNNNIVQSAQHQLYLASGGSIDEFGTSRDPLWKKRSECWVVVVDDEEAIRQAIGQLLFDKGYQVTACGDGQTALNVALNKRTDSNGNKIDAIPDCIVSDVRMPNMDGIALVKNIRSDDRLSEIPVVLVTAKGMTQDRIAGYDSGADAYLTKPFDPDELVAIVDNVIDRHEILNGERMSVDDLKQDLDEIKKLTDDSDVGLVLVSDDITESINDELTELRAEKSTLVFALPAAGSEKTEVDYRVMLKKILGV